MDRFKIPALALSACLAPLLFAQTTQPTQSSQPAGQTADTTAAPVATPQDVTANKKDEKKAEKKAKKAKKEEGDALPPGMVPGHLIYSVPAEKPAMARSAHISGTVTLKATVEPDGSVKHIKAVDGPPMLQQAAIDAVSQWKYSPYLLNGQPAPAPTTIQIKFK